MKTGGGFNPEDEKSPAANPGDKVTKPVPGCAVILGTGNDSGCLLAKVPCVMFELMVCKVEPDLSKYLSLIIIMMFYLYKIFNTNQSYSIKLTTCLFVKC